MPPKPSPYPPPDFDPTHAYPEFAPLQAAVAGRDWPTVSACFERLGDVDGRNVAVRVAGEVQGSTLFFTDVVAVEPGSVLARLLLASSLIEAGWAIRTGYRAKHVSREQFGAFHDHLRRAEHILIDITAREPDNVPAWTERLITARGLELGQAEARRRYDRIARQDPSCLGAQVQLLQQLCPKWSGDFERAHAFARECADAAPPGAPNAALIADYHWERCLDMPLKDRAEYLRRPEVRQEIRDAGGRSVLHPAHRPGYRSVWAHNLFAAVFSSMGDYGAAAVHFRAIGHLGSRVVWGYLGDPARAFAEHRDRALAKG